MTSASHTQIRFHRLRYKLAPVAVKEVSLGELQHFVMPDHQLSSGEAVGNTVLSVVEAPAVSASFDAGISSKISFKAP